jgi:hypothetical protein
MPEPSGSESQGRDAGCRISRAALDEHSAQPLHYGGGSPDGLVRIYRAAPTTITGTPPRGRTRTGPYVKACSTSLTELDAWALPHAKSGITRCGICQA